MIPRSCPALGVAKASLVVLFLLLSFAAGPASAQVQLGTPKYESFGGGPVDIVNLGNLNVHFTIPILHKPGRGLPFNFDLGYDTTFWQPVLLNTGVTHWEPSNPTGGWSGSTLSLGSLTWLFVTFPSCTYNGQNYNNCLEDYNFAYTDGIGSTHPFIGTAWCLPNGPDLSLQGDIAADDSGYALNWDPCSGAFTMYSTDGNVMVPAGTLLGSGSSASVVDRNGNTISESSSGTFTDTLGTQALTETAWTPALNGGAPYVATYTDPNGHAASVSITWATYTVQTNFACPNITDYQPTSDVYLPDRLTFPNGTYYQFRYEATPGHPGNVTGRLSSIQLPAGGTIQYTYTGPNNGINCADGTAMGLTRRTPDGTWSYVRALGTQGITTTTITDPASNQSVIQFASGLGLFYEQQRQVYRGSVSPGNLLETVTTCYDGNTTNCAGANLTIPLSQRATTTQLGTATSKHVYSYDAYGNPTETDDYDWGTGAVGPLLKKTLFTYASLDKIKSFAQTVTVQNGSGTQIAQTTEHYDDYTVHALQTTSGVPQHFSPPGGSRGNLTSVQQWVNTTGTQLTTRTTQYYDTGTVNIFWDGDANPTTYAYSSAFGQAYPTQITNALNHNTQNNYDANTGVLTWTKNPNDIANNRAGTTYTYDNMLRVTQTNYPDGGQASACNSDAGGTCTKSGPPFSMVATKKMNSTTNIVTTTVTDTQGRTAQTQVNSDTEGVDYTDTTYDSLGRTYTVSNPHRSSSLPTDGTTTNKYDALSRTTEVDDPDGSKVLTAYTGNCTTVTDEASKVRKSCADGMGRITNLFEDPSGLNYEADYTYDALGNLLTVNQKGGTTNSSLWRTRTYTYDSLSRLLSATTPESGKVCNGTYSGSTCQANGYDANGNLLMSTAPAPNQTGTATVTTTYTYDHLNRLTRKTYNDTGTPAPTPPASFNYDESTVWGPIANPIGHLTSMFMGNGPGPTATGAEYSYDAMGRSVLYAQCYPSNCGISGSYNTAYTYDLAGNMLSASNGVNGVGAATISYTYDSADRPATVTSSYVDSQHPATLATFDSTLGYWPNGVMRKVTLGNGLTETSVYNSRMQPCHLNMNSSGGTLSTCTSSLPTGNVQDFSYAYNSGTSDNGNITTWNGAGSDPFTRTYTYDTLNRLSGLSDSTNGNGCPGLSRSYDAWGNRTAQTITSGGCGSWSASYSGSNQITGTGYAYDAAGNLTNDGLHHYYYDAESRLIQLNGTLGTCSSATMCYVYDAKGLRVRSAQPTGAAEYIRDLGGKEVAQWTISSGFTGMGAGFVYLGTEFLAQYSDSTTYFVDPDQLGATRLLTKLDQSIKESLDFAPFGEQMTGGTVTTHDFTGYEWDSETGNNYAMARYYGSRMGSFLTPDPAGKSATCPLNPQTQNRYVYVTDNPVNKTDPTGLCGADDPTPCDPISINLPLFPTGGGDNPAPPAPHPVFGLKDPILNFDGTQRQRCFAKCLNDEVLNLGLCALSGNPYVIAACAIIESIRYYYCWQDCNENFPK